MRPFLLLISVITWFMSGMFIFTAITRNLTNIVDTHAAGEESNGKEETHDKNGNCHENPCNRFQTAVAEGLKHTGSQNTYNKPPDHTAEIAGNKMIQSTGYCDQKKSCRGLT
jgi:hypothetical protein